MQSIVLLKNLIGGNYLIYKSYFSKISAITNVPKMMDAMPFVVKNAKFTLLKSLCLTNVCW